MSQQNILVIMADQLTALALGCYGNPTVKARISTASLLKG